MRNKKFQAFLAAILAASAFSGVAENTFPPSVHKSSAQIIARYYQLLAAGISPAVVWQEIEKNQSTSNSDVIAHIRKLMEERTPQQHSDAMEKLNQCKTTLRFEI